MVNNLVQLLSVLHLQFCFPLTNGKQQCVLKLDLDNLGFRAVTEGAQEYEEKARHMVRHVLRWELEESALVE